jgi:hypothetical protein
MCVNFRSPSTGEIEQIIGEDLPPDLFVERDVWLGYDEPIIRRNADGKLTAESGIFGMVPPLRA